MVKQRIILSLVKFIIYISLVAGDNCVVLFIIMVCGGMGMCKEVS